jgi:hypothetical protein
MLSVPQTVIYLYFKFKQVYKLVSDIVVYSVYPCLPSCHDAAENMLTGYGWFVYGYLGTQ